MSRKRKKITSNGEVATQTLVDVVIPVYGNYFFLEKVLDTLRTGFGTVPYKVYFTDDASPDYKTHGRAIWDGLREKYPEIANVHVHLTNKGYGASVNDSASLGKSKYILIMNSDILLVEYAGKFMAEHLDSSPDVAITFPKLMFFPNSTQSNKPAGKIQHAGIVFDFDGNPYHIFLGWDSDHPFVNTIKDFNACTGACFMIRRETWRTLGGYDLNYRHGYFEDVDLCLRVRGGLNKLIRYLPMAQGYHYTNMSFEQRIQSEGKDKFSESFGYNGAYFRKKMKEVIPYDEFIFNGT